MNTSILIHCINWIRGVAEWHVLNTQCHDVGSGKSSKIIFAKQLVEYARLRKKLHRDARFTMQVDPSLSLSLVYFERLTSLDVSLKRFSALLIISLMLNISFMKKGGRRRGTICKDRHLLLRKYIASNFGISVMIISRKS